MKKKLRYAFYILALGMVIFLYWGVRKDIPLTQLKNKYANKASQFIEIEGMQIHYRKEGKGFPILLLHGTGASLHTWDGWTEILKPHFQVIRLDLPAFGLTGAHPKHAYKLTDYVHIVKKFLQTINVDTCYVAGNSLGGQIAWEYALAYPAEVGKLILIDAAGYPNDKPKPWVFWAARTPALNQVLQYITPMFVFRNNLKQVYEDDTKVTEDLVKRYYELGLRAGNRAAFVARCHVELNDHYQKINTLKMPTLIQWGEKDSWIPVSHAQKFKEDMPQAKVLLYPDLGHIPMEESPEKTAKDALEWLLK